MLNVFLVAGKTNVLEALEETGFRFVPQVVLVFIDQELAKDEIVFLDYGVLDSITYLVINCLTIVRPLFPPDRVEHNWYKEIPPKPRHRAKENLRTYTPNLRKNIGSGSCL